MTANSDAEKYLNYFLDSKSKPDFGILLDGPWGCGKTHFIDNFLKKRNAAAKLSDPLSGSEYLYASLYGVRSRDEITDQFFVQSHPVLNSRPMQVFGSSLAGIFRKFGVQISESGKSGATVKELVLDLTGKILVFDDLERSAMPISDVMGYINSFVEHRHLKVIVVANQEEIPNIEDYRLKKEKLIGKTLKVSANADEVFAHFVTEIQSDAAKAAALRSKDDVINTFLTTGKNNYRSLRAILEDFDRLVSAVDERLKGSVEGLHRLLIYMMATGMAYRSASISAADLAELNSMVMRVRMDLSRTADKNQFDSAKKLMSTYPNVDWSNPIVLPFDLMKVYETGIIDVKSINEHLSTHPLVVGQTNTPPWRQLWSWTDLTRTEYIAARASLLKQLSDFEITHPGELM